MTSEIDRVRIVGDHPHSGETGVIARMGRTLAGVGIVIKLDDCPHNVEECFVFNMENLVFLERG